MPVDYYQNLSVEDLLTLLESLQKRASIGVVYFTTAAGIQTQRSFHGSKPVDVEIRRVLYSLHRKDPVTYSDPYAQRIRKTRVRYTRS